MFARTSLRLASRRAFQPITSATPALRAGFKSTVKVNEPESVQEKHVHVTSYHEGERTQEVMQVAQTGTGPVIPPGADAQKQAIPMNPNLLPQLTPTLQKFTLCGKVAVVTGYSSLGPVLEVRRC